MTICKGCKQEMLGTDTCADVPFRFNGVDYDPIPYGKERGVWESERCHDCNVVKGGYHHPGCDVEECPVCHGQAISCDCVYESEEDAADEPTSN